MYCQRNNSAKTLLEKKRVEEKFEKDFAIFKKKVQKRVREASKDSNQSKHFTSFQLSLNSGHVHKEGQVCEKCLQIQQENNKSFANMARLDGNSLSK